MTAKTKPIEYLPTTGPVSEYDDRLPAPSTNGDGHAPAAPAPETDSDQTRVKEAADDPHRLARIYLANECQHPDGRTLQYWRQEWHRWDGTAYRVIPDRELRADVTRVVKAEMDRVALYLQKQQEADAERDTTKAPPVARKVTSRLVGDVVHALASLSVLSSRTESPAWLDSDDGPFLAGEMLAARNGLVHLPSFVAGKHHFCQPTPLFFSPNVLTYNFDEHAHVPDAWLSFMRSLWPDDQQAIDLLQEWYGYNLLPDTRQQKILLLVGPKRSGKGTIARVLRALIGAENVAGPTLASLATNFGLWPLIGKTLAIISDARLSGRTDAAAVTERLLSISGEDALTVDRKNLQPITTKLNTRLMILTNELPRLGDASGALTSRMVLLRLTQSWYGRENTKLTDELLIELPGILLWSIEGWRRLYARGHFIQPDSSKELLSELDDLSSPVGAFVRENCKVDPGQRVSVDDIFSRWKLWCDQKSRKEHGTEQTFGRDLLAAVPTIRKTRPRDGDERYRAYEGIGLKW